MPPTPRRPPTASASERHGRRVIAAAIVASARTATASRPRRGAEQKPAPSSGRERRRASGPPASDRPERRDRPSARIAAVRRGATATAIAIAGDDNGPDRIWASSQEPRSGGKEPDPNSPFAKLLALKEQLEGNKERPLSRQVVQLDRQRIDKWLWHARVVRTRSAAAALSTAGLVRINGARIDTSSRPVRPGDVVTVALDRNVRMLKVIGFAERRGSAEIARGLFEDLTPPPAPPQEPSAGGARRRRRPADQARAARDRPAAGRGTIWSSIAARNRRSRPQSLANAPSHAVREPRSGAME